MEEPASWKGHSFTLLVFGGIVVLCSIFFVLGMLVGRNQGQRIAEIAAADEANKKTTQVQQATETLNFPTATTEAKKDFELVPAAPPPPAPDPEPAVPAPSPVEPTAVVDKVFLQILATKDSKEAERARDKVQSKGFRALILPPKAGDKDAYHRVQVGPYDSATEADLAKKELEGQGYRDVFRK